MVTLNCRATRRGTNAVSSLRGVANIMVNLLLHDLRGDYSILLIEIFSLAGTQCQCHHGVDSRVLRDILLVRITNIMGLIILEGTTSSINDILYPDHDYIYISNQAVSLERSADERHSHEASIKIDRSLNSVT
jgi:hypothetical protein